MIVPKKDILWFVSGLFYYFCKSMLIVVCYSAISESPRLDRNFMLALVAASWQFSIISRPSTTELGRVHE